MICLDLRGGDARKALEVISGPVTVLLPSLDPELVEQVNRVAGRFPVAVSYETPANLGGEVDLTPLSELSNIQGLELFVGSGELPDLRGLARLRWLALRYAGFAADSLERLPTGIEGLTYDGPLQLDTVGRLGRFPRLKRLSTAMRDLNWSPLDRLRSIEALELPDDITLEDLKGLEKLPHLRELSTRARLGSREFEALARLRELRALRIPEATLSDADAAKLSQLTHLEIFVSPHGVTNDGLKSLASLKKLRTLDLSHAETASADLPWLPELTAVTDLNLQGHTISAATLSKLPRLVRLNLNSAPVDRKLVQAMTKLTQVRDLDLSETSVAESDVQHLLQLEQLRFLNVFHTGIRDGGWLSLAKLPKLRVLLIGPGVARDTCAKLRMEPRLLFVGDVQSRRLWEPLGAGSRCAG
ncbi:MAG: hypothetical protein R3B89_24755 [Polyangiaceae bacterium]